MSFAQWLNDLRWANTMRHARRLRRELPLSEREAFDDALRPPAISASGQRVVIAYPDAIYHIDANDIIRAMYAAAEQTIRRISKS